MGSQEKYDLTDWRSLPFSSVQSTSPSALHDSISEKKLYMHNFKEIFKKKVFYFLTRQSCFGEYIFIFRHNFESITTDIVYMWCFAEIQLEMKSYNIVIKRLIKSSIAIGEEDIPNKYYGE